MSALCADLEPVWVGDSNTREWSAVYGTLFWADAMAWIRSEGVERVEVYLLDAPFAKVWVFVLDANGEPQLNEASDELVTEVRTVVLSSLPPPWPSQ